MENGGTTPIRRTYEYDGFGRCRKVTTEIVRGAGSETFYEYTTYDEYGREHASRLPDPRAQLRHPAPRRIYSLIRPTQPDFPISPSPAEGYRIAHRRLRGVSTWTDCTTK